MAPSDLPPPHNESLAPSRPTKPEEQGTGNEHQIHVIGLMVGTALMFIGFLNVFLSISGGFEINIVPFLIYFGGLAIWANAAIETPTFRYGVMTLAITLALGLFQYGEVLFWHKQVLFWVTIIIVMYFMFVEPKKPTA
jgi:cation transport ATPase